MPCLRLLLAVGSFLLSSATHEYVNLVSAAAAIPPPSSTARSLSSVAPGPAHIQHGFSRRLPFLYPKGISRLNGQDGNNENVQGCDKHILLRGGGQSDNEGFEQQHEQCYEYSTLGIVNLLGDSASFYSIGSESSGSVQGDVIAESLADMSSNPNGGDNTFALLGVPAETHHSALVGHFAASNTDVGNGILLQPASETIGTVCDTTILLLDDNTNEQRLIGCIQGLLRGMERRIDGQGINSKMKLMIGFRSLKDNTSSEDLRAMVIGILRQFPSFVGMQDKIDLEVHSLTSSTEIASILADDLAATAASTGGGENSQELPLSIFQSLSTEIYFSLLGKASESSGGVVDVDVDVDEELIQFYLVDMTSSEEDLAEEENEQQYAELIDEAYDYADHELAMEQKIEEDVVDEEFDMGEADFFEPTVSEPTVSEPTVLGDVSRSLDEDEYQNLDGDEYDTLEEDILGEEGVGDAQKVEYPYVDGDEYQNLDADEYGTVEEDIMIGEKVGEVDEVKEVLQPSMSAPANTGDEGGATKPNAEKERYIAFVNSVSRRILAECETKMFELEAKQDEVLLDPSNTMPILEFGRDAQTILDYAMDALAAATEEIDPAESLYEEWEKLLVETKKNILQEVAGPSGLQNLFELQLQALREYYGRQYESILDRVIRDSADLSVEERSATKDKNEAKLTEAAQRSTEGFRTAAKNAIPILCQSGQILEHLDYDILFTREIQGLMQDMVEATLSQQNLEDEANNAAMDVDDEDDIDEDGDGGDGKAIRRRRKGPAKWYEKIASRALVLGVNYVQGWLALQQLRKAAADRDKAMPKFPLF